MISGDDVNRRVHSVSTDVLAFNLSPVLANYI